MGSQARLRIWRNRRGESEGLSFVPAVQIDRRRNSESLIEEGKTMLKFIAGFIVGAVFIFASQLLLTRPKSYKVGSCYFKKEGTD
jgi:hypothetical protein